MPELTVVVPTFNERDNVGTMVEALAAALQGIDYEIIFVDDDSTDQTAAVVRALAQANPRVRAIQRIRRQGLASAIVEGFLASSADYLAVIDGDLQHDERVLPDMLAKIKADNLDIVIGTRNAGGGSMGSFASSRVRLSHAGRRLAAWVIKGEVTDPMSGFFLLSRGYFEEVAHGLSNTGFKILLDLLATARRPVRIGEVGYTFRTRRLGTSKLNTLAGLEFLELLLDKKLGRWLPVSYLIFGLVGGFGVLVNLALTQMFLSFGESFHHALLSATSLVIALNFFLNNSLTFRARRLKGWRLVSGLAIFYMACSVGLIMNLFLAENLSYSGVARWAAALFGILFSSVWNYGITSLFVWGINQRSGKARSA
jgi:dolichol-phosphate mannosyltransferase